MDLKGLSIHGPGRSLLRGHSWTVWFLAAVKVSACNEARVPRGRKMQG